MLAAGVAVADLAAARSAASRALRASSHVKSAKNPRTATRMPSRTATTAASACESGALRSTRAAEDGTYACEDMEVPPS
jgi:hypothetical protein